MQQPGLEQFEDPEQAAAERMAQQAMKDRLASGEGNDDDDEEEDGDVSVKPRTWTLDYMLQRTKDSYDSRGLATHDEIDEDGNRVQRKRRAKSSNAKPPRIWSPGSEYEQVGRVGHVFLQLPDDSRDMLTERSLTYFKNTDPSVQFAEDPLRPLWKGVFRMHPSLGYREGEQFYDPKQDHLTMIYAKDRPRKSQPSDNLVENRIGGPPLPYWVDDYQHKKNKELKHKDTDRAKKLRMLTEAQRIDNEGDINSRSEGAKMEFFQSAGEDALEREGEEEENENNMLGEQYDYAPGMPSAAALRAAQKKPRKKRAASAQSSERGDPIIAYDNLFFMPLCDNMKSSVKGKGSGGASKVVVPSSCVKTNAAKDILKTGSRLFKECYNALINQQQQPTVPRPPPVDSSVMENVTPAPTGAPESALKKPKKTVTIADPPVQQQPQQQLPKAPLHKPPGYRPPPAPAPTPVQQQQRPLVVHEQQPIAPSGPPDAWVTSMADLRKAANAWDDMINDAYAAKNAALVPPYWRTMLEGEAHATDPRVVLTGFFRFLDTRWFAKKK